jgi:thiamine kinase-like enzyme
MTFAKLPKSLNSLLRHIDETRPVGRETWNDSIIARIDGGANNLLYRVLHEGDDLACKFTITDERNRARREYAALSVMQERGLEISPSALWLDEESYSQPLVLQTWIDGDLLTGPPESSSEWHRLIEHYSSIHTLKRRDSKNRLEKAALNFQNGQQGKKLVLLNASKVPAEEHPKQFTELLQWFENWTPPVFPDVTLALCRADANWRNFIEFEDKIVSVDWENSGWGDPAFEIADLITHPAYETVNPDEWETIINIYAKLTDDPNCEIRIRTYHLEMLMWWVIRWLRYLYEIPHGLDNRLVQRSDDWKPRTERKLELSIKTLQDHIAKL